MTPDLALDALIALSLAWLAWRCLGVSDLFAAISLFIAFGMLTALAFVRLSAPDVALAEAAIGAGVTGAMLLDASAHFGRRDHALPVLTARTLRLPGRPARAIVSGMCGALGIVLVVAVVQVGPGLAVLPGLVADNMARTGVTNTVTAVLLDFRAYDTFLEVTVLLVAVAGAMAVRRAVRLRPLVEQPGPDPVLVGMVRVVVPVMFLTGGYLLYVGTHAPGGAFQAGAVLAGATIVLFLAKGKSAVGYDARTLVFVAALGVLAFLSLAWALAIGGRRLLDLPPSNAAQLTVVLELAVGAAVAAGLAGLAAAARQRGADS